MSEDFDVIVDAVMETLAPEFRARLDNLAILVLPDSNNGKLGEYYGWGERAPFFGRSQAAPNQIVLYEQPIRRQAETAEQLYAAVQQVLMHELGHYFGLTHADMGAHFVPVAR